MAESEKLHPAIARMKGEFEDHAKKSAGLEFRPTLEASAAISNLTKDLEIKRQTRDLTRQEASWLTAIDKLQEEIIKFNQGRVTGLIGGPASPEATPEGEKIYYPKAGELKPFHEDVKKPPIVPYISESQADEVIHQLDEQFREKVLKKLKKPPDLDMNFAEDRDFRPANMTQEVPGRSLKDYISLVKAERPTVPFEDEDSHIDLSHIKRKHAARQKN